MAKEKLSDVLSIAQDASSRSIGDAIGKTGCYTANVAELLDEIKDEFIDVDGNFIKFEFEQVVKLLNALWAKVKESADECDGKKISVKLPAGLVGQLLAGVLAIIGIKL